MVCMWFVCGNFDVSPIRGLCGIKKWSLWNRDKIICGIEIGVSVE